MFQIGPYRIDKQTVLAPMAGISDQPFRTVCSHLGAGLVVGEMLTSDIHLWNSKKSHNRLQHAQGTDPVIMQIAGSEPRLMAEAAQQAVLRGAQIIDLNMGCPAKKVCNKAAGSALLRDESLVAAILTAVCSAVQVPVTLKTRTGWCKRSRNALRVAKLAEDTGIAALTLHGRTRECRFNGEAEYDSIAEVAAAVKIPVIANGDIDNAVKARAVLQHTGAAAVMVGRAARGNPWIFEQIEHYLSTGRLLPKPSRKACHRVMIQHLESLHQFYGAVMGVRIARKHIGWYLNAQFGSESFAADLDGWRRNFNVIDQREEQIQAVYALFERLQQLEDQAA